MSTVNNLSPESLVILLKEIDACSEARDWVKGLDYDTAWKTCSEPSWLFFLIRKTVPLTRMVNELLVCRLARELLHLNNDPRILAGIEVREAWARGEVSDEVRSDAIQSLHNAFRSANKSVIFASQNPDWGASEAAGVAMSHDAYGAMSIFLPKAIHCDIIREIITQPSLI